MAKKKGGQLRFCCDCRYLNAVALEDAYPIPRIDDRLSKLGDARFFTTLDLGSAWQVPLRKKYREKTGFACELELYQWKRMPFDLRDARRLFNDSGPKLCLGYLKIWQTQHVLRGRRGNRDSQLERSYRQFR